MVSKPLGVVLQLTAAVLIFWAIMSFFDETGNPFTAIPTALIGLVLLLIGGRTKARLK